MIHPKKLLLTSLCFLFFGNSHAQLTHLNYDHLVQVKEAINQSSETYLPAYLNLLTQADVAMQNGPYAVTYKKRVAISGDKHDYLSLAPYWWPDPTKKEGLPWIRKDGIVNPMTRGENVDRSAAYKLFSELKLLSLAFFFSDKSKYASKINQLLKVWFLDKNTRMNPHLKYAQGIPGKNVGRGFGIIEFSGVQHVITALEILQLKAAIPQQDIKELRAWLSEYLIWLQESEFGIFAKTRSNNHGSLYDVQVVSILLFLNQEENAKTILNSVFKQRITPQINADGSQPHELKRTKSLTYSILNLTALVKLAFMGNKVGVNIAEKASIDGDLQKAFNFLSPYLDKNHLWPYQQIGNYEDAISRLSKMFVYSGSLLMNKSHCEIMLSQENLTDIDRLLYPCIR